LNNFIDFCYGVLYNHLKGRYLMNQVLKRLVLSAKGKVSWTKMGLWITDIAHFISTCQDPIGSDAFWAALALHIGALALGIGARDAIDNSKKAE
jgi:hypothetical protein